MKELLKEAHFSRIWRPSMDNKELLRDIIAKHTSGLSLVEIQSLADAIAAANVLAPEWIPVATAVIPADDSILCKSEYGSRYVGYFDGENWRLSFTSECVSADSIPTHFQHLPAAPKDNHDD
jgi:hypothetical protein